MKAVIICGSREWSNGAAIAALVRSFPPDTVVIHGDCRGADRLAHAAAKTCGLSVVPMPAQWSKHNRVAGPTRNTAMIMVLKTLARQGYGVSVHAFLLPGSRGTRNMLELAEREAIETVVHEPGGENGSR